MEITKCLVGVGGDLYFFCVSHKVRFFYVKSI
jgi:hypothetical protein